MQEKAMAGIETAAIVFVCVLLGVALIATVATVATAWWVSGINTILVRLAVELEARHLELRMERTAEKRMREVRQKQFFQWLAETASTLNGLREIAAKVSDRQDTVVMRSPLQSPDAPVSEPMPSTVKPPRKADAALLGAEPIEDVPNESDADTVWWRGPVSSRTLLGAGVMALSEPKHGLARAHQLAQELRKPER
jgi:hypothetical protein